MMHLAAGALLMGIFEMNLNDPAACKSPSPKDGPQLDLPIVLHYGDSERTAALRNLAGAEKHATPRVRRAYYGQSIAPIVACAFGAIAAFAHTDSHPFFIGGIILLWYTIVLSSGFRSYNRRLREQILPDGLSDEYHPISLEITRDGLIEYQGDIMSFVPWKDVTGTILEDDLLIITLSYRLEARIPRHSLPGCDIDLERIREVIEQIRTLQETPRP